MLLQGDATVSAVLDGQVRTQVVQYTLPVTTELERVLVAFEANAQFYWQELQS